MNFKLNVINGKVKYILKQKDQNIGSDTPFDSAMWLLRQGKPQKSAEIAGYPIAVKTQNGDEYHFSGEWLMGAEKDILGEDAPQDDAQNAEPVEAPKPRKRRAKDSVLE